MKKLIIVASLLFISMLNISAQSVPQVSVELSANSAAMDQTVQANVYIETDLEMIGADVEITVDSPCLEISGEYVQGNYFTPGDGNSVVLFNKITPSSARVAANMLNFDLNPKAGDLYFSVPLTVKCKEGTANITVSEAQLVQRGIIEYKLSESQITASNGVFEITDAPVEIPMPTATVIPPTAVPEGGDLVTEPAVESDNSGLILAAGGLIGFAFVGILLLFVMNRRRSRTVR